jgi:pectinesterase
MQSMARHTFQIMLLMLAGRLLAADPGYALELSVASDGSAQYATIQSAIDATKSYPDYPIAIRIAAGIYREKVRVPPWNPRLTLQGDGPDKTILVWDDHFDRIQRGRNSTFHTYTLKIEANEVRVESLTIENAAGPVGQAVALHVEGDRCSFEACLIKGHQDTVFLDGEGSRHFFKGCSIEGTTDFIFGQATAWFQDCQIHAKSDSFITAASTSPNQSHGLVFYECQFTAAPSVKEVRLGRPWRAHARTVLISCILDSAIHPEGWGAWSHGDQPTTTYYAEYQSTGKGARPSMRVEWSHQLTEQELSAHSRQKVLRGWNPDPLR